MYLTKRILIIASIGATFLTIQSQAFARNEPTQTSQLQPRSILSLAAPNVNEMADQYKTALKLHGDGLNRNGHVDGTFLPSAENPNCNQANKRHFVTDTKWMVKHVSKREDDRISQSLDRFRGNLSKMAKAMDKQLKKSAAKPQYLLQGETLSAIYSDPEQIMRQRKEWTIFLNVIRLTLVKAHVKDPKDPVIAIKLSITTRIQCEAIALAQETIK